MSTFRVETFRRLKKKKHKNTKTSGRIQRRDVWKFVWDFVKEQPEYGMDFRKGIALAGKLGQAKSEKRYKTILATIRMLSDKWGMFHVVPPAKSLDENPFRFGYDPVRFHTDGSRHAVVYDRWPSGKAQQRELAASMVIGYFDGKIPVVIDFHYSPNQVAQAVKQIVEVLRSEKLKRQKNTNEVSRTMTEDMRGIDGELLQLGFKALALRGTGKKFLSITDKLLPDTDALDQDAAIKRIARAVELAKTVLSDFKLARLIPQK